MKLVLLFLLVTLSALGVLASDGAAISISIEGPLPLATQLTQLEDMKVRGVLDDNTFAAAIYESTVVGPLINSLAVLGALHSRGSVSDEEFAAAKGVAFSRHVAGSAAARKGITAQPAGEKAAAAADAASEINALTALLESGQITDEEFSMMKSAAIWRHIGSRVEDRKRASASRPPSEATNNVSSKESPIARSKPAEGIVPSNDEAREASDATTPESEKEEVKQQVAEYTSDNSENVDSAGDEINTAGVIEEDAAGAAKQTDETNTEEHHQGNISEANATEEGVSKTGQNENEQNPESDVSGDSTSEATPMEAISAETNILGDEKAEEMTVEGEAATINDIDDSAETNASRDESANDSSEVSNAKDGSIEAKVAQDEASNAQEEVAEAEGDRSIEEAGQNDSAAAQPTTVEPTENDDATSTSEEESGGSSEVFAEKEVATTPEAGAEVDEKASEVENAESSEASGDGAREDEANVENDSEVVVENIVTEEEPEPKVAGVDENNLENAEDAEQATKTETPEKSEDQPTSDEGQDTSCVGWRQTGGCAPEGPREAHSDRECNDEVPAGASGYCECSGGGRRVAESTCDHGPFNCAAMCAGTCAGWRQTGGCTPTGPREDHSDLPCDAEVPAGASGYCECSGGRRAAESDCDHGPFMCAMKCAE